MPVLWPRPVRSVCEEAMPAAASACKAKANSRRNAAVDAAWVARSAKAAVDAAPRCCDVGERQPEEGAHSSSGDQAKSELPRVDDEDEAREAREV
jgi:hypothetical protein